MMNTPESMYEPLTEAINTSPNANDPNCMHEPDDESRRDERRRDEMSREETRWG